MKNNLRYNFTPGSANVPDFVMDAIAQPVIPHRSQAFEDFFETLQPLLKYLFQTESPVLSLAGSGTFGVEIAIKSLFRKGDQIAVTSFGKFSERWVHFSKKNNLQVTQVVSEWGSEIYAEEILRACKSIQNLKGLVLTHCDTSTGIVLDLQEIAKVVRKEFPDLIMIADTISTVGAIPFFQDEWGLDIAVVVGQKALCNPVGTVFVSISERASKLLNTNAKSDYFELGTYYAALMENSVPFTPPAQLLCGIKAALEKLKSETLQKRWNQIKNESVNFKTQIESIGANFPAGKSNDVLSLFSFQNCNMEKLKSDLESEGIWVAGGQENWSGKIIRVAHFGGVDPEGYHKLLESLKNKTTVSL